MERLLARAKEISKVEYNIDNLGDVYEAIHVIQDDLGLTGVAADEAKTTFTGSFGAMKAAAENLMANLALGENLKPALDTLGQTVQTFLFNNLFPMVGNILSALPDLLSGISGIVIGALNQIGAHAPEIIQQGIQIVTSLIEGIVSAIPYMIEAAIKLAAELGKALINTDWISIGKNLMDNLGNSIDLASDEIFGADTSIIDGILNSIMTGLPLILDMGIQLINFIVDGIISSIPTLISTVTNVISTFINFWTTNFPKFLSAGVELLAKVANGIIQNLPNLISSISTIINAFVNFWMQNFPRFISAGIDLVLKLATGIIQNLPAIVRSVQQLIQSFVSTITSNLPTIIQQGIAIVGKLVAGLIQAIPTIVAAIPQLISAIVNGFGNFDWLSIGVNIVKGIANGLKDAAGMIADAAKDAARKAFEAAKDFLGISSPATKGIYIGAMYDAGIAEGIVKNKSLIDSAMEDLSQNSFDGFTASADYDFQGASYNEDKIDELIALLRAYLPEIAEKEGVNINQLFNGINRQLGWGVQ